MRFLFFLLIIFLLTNCKQEKKSISAFDFYPPIPDSAKNDFMSSRIGNTNQFNLSTLFSGTNDSLVIRFWPSEALGLWTNMFEFRLDTNGWRGYHYCSYTFPNQDGKLFRIRGHEKLGDSVFVVKKITPKCGWEKFYDSLIFYQLKNLPTLDLVKDFQFKPMLDGYSFTFEIATKNSYRCINYANPDVYSYKECKQITELVDMIIRQFGDNYFWPTITNNENFGS